MPGRLENYVGLATVPVKPLMTEDGIPDEAKI